MTVTQPVWPKGPSSELKAGELEITSGQSAGNQRVIRVGPSTFRAMIWEQMRLIERGKTSLLSRDVDVRELVGVERVTEKEDTIIM